MIKRRCYREAWLLIYTQTLSAHWITAISRWNKSNDGVQGNDRSTSRLLTACEICHQRTMRVFLMSTGHHNCSLATRPGGVVHWTVTPLAPGTIRTSADGVPLFDATIQLWRHHACQLYDASRIKCQLQENVIQNVISLLCVGCYVGSQCQLLRSVPSVELVLLVYSETTRTKQTPVSASLHKHLHSYNIIGKSAGWNSSGLGVKTAHQPSV